MRTLIAMLLLLFQLGAIVYARFVPTRYFCWAPYDMQTDYRLEVTVNGKPLTAEQIRRRYRRPQKGTDNRSVSHVTDILRQYQERYARGEDTRIVMRYRINGKDEQIWRWPEQQ